MITWADFEKVDMRVGTIVEAVPNQKAKKPAYRLTIDFGADIGIKTSSAQLTGLYAAIELIGRQVIAVVNFPPRQVAEVMSQVLVLGINTPDGVALLGPDRTVADGERVF
nr:tRNA-binding protein [bacterium]